MEDAYKTLYKQEKGKAEYYRILCQQETEYSRSLAAELEQQKKNESRAFLRGVYVACVTFLVVVGIVAACVR